MNHPARGGAVGPAPSSLRTMVILGLLLITGGALLIVAAVFTAEITAGQLEVLGTEVGALTLFLLGVGAGIAILWGVAISKFGAKRSLAKRREGKKIDELSEKLQHAESERRRDIDEDDPDRRPY